MSNFQPGNFEFFITSPSAAQKVVITAHVSHHDRGGSVIRFTAEERGTFITADVPEFLSGMNYTKRIGQPISFFDTHLWQLNTPLASSLANSVKGMGKGFISGEAACDALWTLFWELVLADPESNFVESIVEHKLTEFKGLIAFEDHTTFLTELRADALKIAAKAAASA